MITSTIMWNYNQFTQLLDLDRNLKKSKEKSGSHKINVLIFLKKKKSTRNVFMRKMFVEMIIHTVPFCSISESILHVITCVTLNCNQKYLLIVCAVRPFSQCQSIRGTEKQHNHIHLMFQGDPLTCKLKVRYMQISLSFCSCMKEAEPELWKKEQKIKWKEINVDLNQVVASRQKEKNIFKLCLAQCTIKPGHLNGAVSLFHHHKIQAN